MRRRAAQRLPEAGSALTRAIAFAPERPEAWIERGGLRFLEARYGEACSDLRAALRIKDDPYARDLLAASLYLSGRVDEALEEWNRLGKPILRTVTITGLVSAKDQIARRELSMEEGALLDVRAFRAARLRLKEVGIFDRITLRPVPRDEGTADLEVVLRERTGFGSLPSLLLGAGVDAFSHRVRVGYADLMGEGASVSSQYRWQSTRPEVSLSLDWPRPFGAPFYLHLHSFGGRQQYELGDGLLERRGGGGEVSARHVLGARSVWEMALRVRDRTFSRPRADAPSGAIVGLEAGFEETFKETGQQRLAAAGHLFQTVAGSNLHYTWGLATLNYRLLLRPPDGFALEHSALAAQLHWGLGTRGTPIDEQFVPGGSPDMELPLRAHPEDQNGVLGVTPIGRSLLLGNVEWRQRIIRATFFQVGVVLFYDGARIGDTTLGPSRVLHDVGVGLRLTVPGVSIVRIDYGHGLADGANALFIGLGPVF
jgi:hypothetical protein